MKRIFSLAGIGAGLFAIIVSFCLFAGLGKGNWSVTSSPYDSGFASFGADYYTYSVNNSAEAASAARAAAHNVSGLCEVVEVCSAWAIFFLGLMAICAFGIVFASTLPPKATTSPIMFCVGNVTLLLKVS